MHCRLASNNDSNPRRNIFWTAELSGSNPSNVYSDTTNTVCIIVTDQSFFTCFEVRRYALWLVGRLMQSVLGNSVNLWSVSSGPSRTEILDRQFPLLKQSVSNLIPSVCSKASVAAWFPYPAPFPCLSLTFSSTRCTGSSKNVSCYVSPNETIIQYLALSLMDAHGGS